MEGIHRGAHFDTFLRDSKLPSCNVKQLSQRGGMDKAIHLQNLTDHTPQWIFRNKFFHDRKNGYLQNKTADKLLQHINSLSEVSPEELPESSRFLLEIIFSKLSKHHLETQRYWTLAVDVALKANALEQARGMRVKRVWRKLNTKVPSRWKLGIAAVEHQIRQDGMHQAGSSSNPHAIDPLQSSLATFIRRRPHPALVIARLWSNKRLRKPD